MVAVTVIVEVKLGVLQGHFNQVRKLLDPSIIQVCILLLNLDHYGTNYLQFRFEVERLLRGFQARLKEV